MDATASNSRRFSLRFISGKHQGGEHPITPGRDLVIGRSSDIDIALIEDMVSRRHARVIWQADELLLEDLGSTNGTFVNGEKIQRVRLKEGDKILIGTNILRVVASSGSTWPVAVAVADADAKIKLQDPTGGGRTSQIRIMSGTLSEIPLPDLLQLFTSNKKSGVVELRRDEDVGRIHLRRGMVVHGSINENADIPPLKAVYRLLTWEDGTFEFGPPDDREFADPLDVPIEAILMEGMRQIDEMRRLAPLMPARNAHLSLPSPLVPPLSDLGQAELDVLQLAFNHGYLDAVLNRSKTADCETCEVIVKLLAKGYLRKG
jgi:pSer/pThr/pTyr-binding forkhead associated (FHA) protein